MVLRTNRTLAFPGCWEELQVLPVWLHRVVGREWVLVSDSEGYPTGKMGVVMEGEHSSWYTVSAWWMPVIWLPLWPRAVTRAGQFGLLSPWWLDKFPCLPLALYLFPVGHSYFIFALRKCKVDRVHFRGGNLRKKRLVILSSSSLWIWWSAPGHSS